MNNVPHDYKLVGLLPWLIRGEPEFGSIQTPELKPIYDAATTNLHRSDGIITTIVIALYMASIKANDSTDMPDMKYEDIFRRGLEIWAQVETLKVGPNSVAPFSLGIEGVLSAYLVQAWTTFETLATDTWITSLNHHPVILAELRGRKSQSQRDDKKVDLSWLQRKNYDLSHSMGDVLREKFHFDDIVGMRKAYQAAFAEDGQEIIEALNGEVLTAFSAVRNVLVHRAGIADAKYVSLAENLSLAPKANVGEPLKLDGDLVSNLLFTGRDLAVRMFMAVDDWLVAHPVNAPT